MNRQYFIIFFYTLLLGILGLASLGEADSITAPGSGSSAPAPNPLGIISNIYQFALMIGGLLAFGMVVYGGIKYALAAGNPGAQSDARDQITQALLGLLLLLGATIIFNTIGITAFGLPGIASVNLPPSVSLVPIGGYGCDKTVAGNTIRYCSSKPDCSDEPQCAGATCKPIYACVPSGPPGGKPGWGCLIGGVVYCQADQWNCENSGFSECRKQGVACAQRNDCP